MSWVAATPGAQGQLVAVSTPAAGSIGILAGGGRLPVIIAESVAARGGRVHIVAIDGEADQEIARFPHTWVNWAQIGRIVATLKAQGNEMVIVGGVRRPDLWKLRPDWGFFANLPQLGGFLAGGDDSVLSRIVRFFEAKGFTVRGAHEVAPELLAAAGRIGAVALSRQNQADAMLGFAVRAALGPLDAGQAVTVAEGRVLAIEGAEGTDAMLERVAALDRPAGEARRGVLTKGPKPGQELRVDLPAIGPRTMQRVLEAGLAGIAVEAGAVLMLDREETIRVANDGGCAIEGLPNAGMGLGEASRLPAVAGRLVGRVRPSARDRADIAKGLAAIERLARYDTGAAVVVARAYLLAFAATESSSSMLERVSALRQWGMRSRRVGVLVCRADQTTDNAALESLFEAAARQGLAGIAAAGSSDALARYEEMVQLSDALGLFLVTCASAA